MKAPICETCTDSRTLCSNCTARLKQAEITQMDVDLSWILRKFEKKGVLINPSFDRAIEVDNYLLVLTEKENVPALIGKSGRMVRVLSEETGKKVRIIGKGSVTDMIGDLVFPARIYGMNTVYTPEGERYKVIIPAGDRQKLVLNEETLKKAVRVFFDTSVEVAFK